MSHVACNEKSHKGMAVRFIGSLVSRFAWRCCEASASPSPLESRLMAAGSELADYGYPIEGYLLAALEGMMLSLSCVSAGRSRVQLAQPVGKMLFDPFSE